ncbi:Os11g0556132 [Oryza sativa Japonica Group]|uniref:Os11g0556132 protein n=1 Tax=Oryza sativa subsp. japonica TaxID=39947 RepID=A0A0P0Y3B1_ORYSJ|nr:hypothetical protein EE612_056125 [Oryza sativa]BAT14445.1 Os11g0556132 [Oryza sativa Japonica Group]
MRASQRQPPNIIKGMNVFFFCDSLIKHCLSMYVSVVSSQKFRHKEIIPFLTYWSIPANELQEDNTEAVHIVFDRWYPTLRKTWVKVVLIAVHIVIIKHSMLVALNKSG